MATEKVLGCFAIKEVHWLTPNVLYVLFLTSDSFVGMRFRSALRALDVVRQFGPVSVTEDRIVVDRLTHLVQGLTRTKENESGLLSGERNWELDWSSIASADKRNFRLPYAEIRMVGMKRSSIGPSTQRSGKVVVLTYSRRLQYDIVFSQRFDDCVYLLSALLKDKVKA